MLNVNVGIFYELPDGRIVDTFGFDGKNKTISYRFEGGDHLLASYEEVETWKPREDLKDWPNAIDPRLPYQFDLFFDIKRMSQLRAALGGFNCGCREKDLREMMKEHGIECEAEEPPEIDDTERIDSLQGLGTGNYKPERMDFDRYIVIHEACGTQFANAYCISRNLSHSLKFYSEMAKDIRIDFPELTNNELECTTVTKSRQYMGCSVIKFRVPVETTKEGWNKIFHIPEWSVG